MAEESRAYRILPSRTHPTTLMLSSYPVSPLSTPSYGVFYCPPTLDSTPSYLSLPHLTTSYPFAPSYPILQCSLLPSYLSSLVYMCARNTRDQPITVRRTAVRHAFKSRLFAGAPESGCVVHRQASPSMRTRQLCPPIDF